MKSYMWPVVIEKDEEGYVVTCPALQGCYTQGDTYEEAIENIKEAIKLHIESRLEHGEEIVYPDLMSLATVEVRL